jgi:hypothetical protein
LVIHFITVDDYNKDFLPNYPPDPVSSTVPFISKGTAPICTQARPPTRSPRPETPPHHVVLSSQLDIHIEKLQDDCKEMDRSMLADLKVYKNARKTDPNEVESESDRTMNLRNELHKEHDKTIRELLSQNSAHNDNEDSDCVIVDKEEHNEDIKEVQGTSPQLHVHAHTPFTPDFAFQFYS